MFQVNVISVFSFEAEVGGCFYYLAFVLFGQGNFIFVREKSGKF